MGLATYGGARVPSEWNNWLLSIGVAQRSDEPDWLAPTNQFIADSLPSQNAFDLVRRVAVRDPMYRLHLDWSLITVIHAVAAAERWRRLEEILFDSCRAVAPRLMQLLEWQIARIGRAARELTDADWNRTHQSILNGQGATFSKWDQQLWGECRGPADLFPLLLSLYLPLCKLPVHIIGGEPPDERTHDHCLRLLVEAAVQGEGVEFDASRAVVIRNLQDRGVPVRIWEQGSSHFRALLVAPVTFESSPSANPNSYSPAPVSVPAAARRSCSVSRDRSRLPSRLSALDSRENTFIPCSVPADCTRWPAQSSDAIPNWIPLPSASELDAAVKRRDGDQPLRDLAEHPLYGLLLQLLLLEALDRELGEETVILAPPVNRRIENFDQWAETVVLYRPREDKTNNLPLLARGFHVLGRFDDVFAVIAREVGVAKIASPLEPGSGTPWSRALALMSTADLIVGKHDRWTITTDYLDRLHSGALMKDIIRQGRALREKMHGVFLALWRERSNAGNKEVVTA